MGSRARWCCWLSMIWMAIGCSPSVAPETVLLIVMDSVSNAMLSEGTSAGAISADRTPNLARFAEASVRYDEHFSVSTGTQPTVASLMTGLLPGAHGVGSLRRRGRGRLDPAFVTQAERFRDAGYDTIAAVALPQLRADLSGLLQGFETVFEPELHVRASWTSTDLVTRCGPALETRLRSNDPVFAFVYLGDGRAHLRRSSRPSAEVLRRRMGPFQGPDPRLREALALADDDPFLALEELDELLGRSRGTAAYAALQAAKRDAVLAAMDVGFGSLLDALERTGRRSSATVCVLGGAAPDADGRYSLDGIRTLCLLRLRGERTAGRVGDGIQVPALLALILEAHGLGSLPVTPDPVMLCLNRERSAGTAIGSSLRLERDPGGTQRVYRREDGASVEPDGLDGAGRASLEELSSALERSLARPTWCVESTLDSDLRVGWAFAEGGVLSSQVEGQQAELRSHVDGSGVDGNGVDASGAITLTDDAGWVVLRGDAADRPMRLRLESEAFAAWNPARYLFGSEAFEVLPVLWLPSNRRPAPETGDGSPVMDGPSARLTHAGGGWWDLLVQGPEGAAVKALVALFPPAELDEELDVDRAGFEGSIEAVDGRGDALWVRGSLPMRLRLKKEPGRELALHVAVDDRALSPRQLHVGERPYATGDGVDLYLPDWIPGLTDALDALPDGTPAPVELARGQLRITRGVGAPVARLAFDGKQRTFVRRLGDHE